MLDAQNIIQLLKTASGLIFSQKNLAIYKELSYKEPNSLLNSVGIDTNQILGGLFGEVEEVLAGGSFGGAVASQVNEALSFLLETEPMSITIAQPTRIFEHPLETNIGKNTNASDVSAVYKNQQNFIADHSIVLPIVMNLKLVLPKMFYQSVDKQLNRMNKEKWLLVVVSRANVYHNMVVQQFSHTEEPNTFDRMIYDIQLREIQAEYPLANIVKNADDESKN